MEMRRLEPTPSQIKGLGNHSSVASFTRENVEVSSQPRRAANIAPNHPLAELEPELVGGADHAAAFGCRPNEANGGRSLCRPRLGDPRRRDRWPAGLGNPCLVDDGSTDATLPAIVAANMRNPAAGSGAFALPQFRQGSSAGTQPRPCSRREPSPDGRRHAGNPRGAAGRGGWHDGSKWSSELRRSRERDGWTKRVTAGLYYRAHNAVSADEIPENAGEVHPARPQGGGGDPRPPERNRFMKGLLPWAGFKRGHVKYDRAERKNGTTKFSYWKLWTLALDGVASGST